ncbi:hypothetical protein [Candidatus Nitrosocosmicus hydrocola]|nr:hypothetical protein [Candidatus Nitrosocosmicus hydrocola]
MSFSDIGQIIRDCKEREARKNLNDVSEETKAIDLFLKVRVQLK